MRDLGCYFALRVIGFVAGIGAGKFGFVEMDFACYVVNCFA